MPRGLLDDPDTKVQAAARSPGRIGDNAELERIYRRWRECSALSERTLYTLPAGQYGLIPPLGALYREEGARGSGELYLPLEESRDTPFMLESGEEIDRLWSRGEFEAVWLNGHWSLAGLYFTDQFLTAEAES